MADDTPLTDEALAVTCQQVGELLEAEGRLIRVAGNVERGKQIQEAARRLRARGTWQPIATAPKDGTLLLLHPSRHWCEDVEPCDYEVGYWDAENESWEALGRAADDYEGPTHWQPLAATIITALVNWMEQDDE